MNERRPYWPAVTLEAFQPHNLPRVLGAMAFDRYCGSVKRGDIAWWRPAYVAIPADLFRSYGERGAAYLVSRREGASILNRAMRDSPVHLLATDGRIICIDEFAGEGAWRSADGANRGESLINLGMWRWATSYGKAAGRIARLIGMDTIPTIAAEPRQRIAA